MCGIYGVLRPARGGSEELARMGRALAHRGPDGQGLESAPGAMFGHRRLAIIDLSSAGAQPMWDAEQRLLITYNGEIYNYRELAAECRAAGLSFRSSSDTEAILGQFRLHRERAFERLEGMFAFALQDASTGESWLVRDPAGIKPLYWSNRPEGLFFASDLGGLCASGLIPREIDRGGLQAYLQLDFVPAPLSILRGVQKLREGHALHLDAAGRLSIRRFASLTMPSGPSTGPFETEPFETEAGEARGHGSDPVRVLDQLLRRAVARQLVGDVPVGVFLSGGIDSSLVASAAVEAAGPIDSFSIGFEDPSYDESRWAEMVARRLGTRHHAETFGPQSMLEMFPALASITTEPLADASIFPTFLLARFARGELKAVLSGDGGDELFAGYPTHRVAKWGALASRLPSGIARGLLWGAHRCLPPAERDLSREFLVKKFLEGLHPDPFLRNARWLGTFRSEELPDLLECWEPEHQPRLEASLREPGEEAGAAPLLERILRTDQRFYLQDQVLAKVDRASMASALEVRVPFLDGRLVQFARSLPPEQKLRRGTTKAILRRLAAERFPPSLARRPKKGFGVPLARWLRGELRDLLLETLSPARLAAAGLFRPAFVGRLIDEHLRGERDHRKRLFNLLAFQLWHEESASWGRSG